MPHEYTNFRNAIREFVHKFVDGLPLAQKISLREHSLYFKFGIAGRFQTALDSISAPVIDSRSSNQLSQKGARCMQKQSNEQPQVLTHARAWAV
jgi:hypothetical protein